MPRLSLLVFLLALPLLLAAGGMALDVDLSGFDPRSEVPSPGWGTLIAPNQPRLPVTTVNVILPPDTANLQYSHFFSDQHSSAGPAPEANPPFTDGERVLDAPAFAPSSPAVSFLGLHKWGDVRYASFRILPAIWDGHSWQGYEKLRLDLNWTESRDPSSNLIPPVLTQSDRSGALPMEEFFTNPDELARHYRTSQTRNYDYLIVSTPALYAAVSALETFRQSQGLVTAFADISTILTTSPGASPGAKLRNYLISAYAAQPFSYLLLVGDHDTVPVLHVTPEPDGTELVPSDFFYGDLSSVMDADGDGRLGEYSPGADQQDWLCDFTPEVWVGRISTNSAAVASQIAARTVAYDQSTAPWKQSAILPAAFLNYQGEPLPVFLQTDGATLMEYAKATALSAWQTTTLYEQTGFVPSYPSDLPLDYTILKSQLSNTSYGILNWSAHGSATSSARKIWMNDANANGLPDPSEMSWQNLVTKASFDNLTNPDGLVLFCASCNNGYLDYSSSCLAEYALEKKAVSVLAATRTGWYKVGWANPGWGGLTSYNLHWLENLAENRMSTGAATGFTNLIHTQYYLFGDPVDEGGIIWPELKNVYTNLLFGDPALRHSGNQSPPQAEILVYEPTGSSGARIVDAINANGRFNVIYTNKLIPDYDYIDRFEAIFCLFGWGPEAHVPAPDSLDHALLDSYLANGGRIYLEGDLPWDPSDSFQAKFGTQAPLDVVAYIEGLACPFGDPQQIWDYDLSDPETYAALPLGPNALTLFNTANISHGDNSVGIYNSAGGYKTIASAFALAGIPGSQPGLRDLVGLILGCLDVIPNHYIRPLAPSGLAITLAGDDAILTWDPVSQNLLGQAVAPSHYELSFSPDGPQGEFSPLGTTPTLQYIHPSAGTLYPQAFYRVGVALEE